MVLSVELSEKENRSGNPRKFAFLFAAAIALALAPLPAYAQHGGGGGGGGHAGGGGGFGGGGGHSGGGFHGGGGGRVSGGGSRGGSYGGYSGGSSSEVHSAHGSPNSNGGGHWWSGFFGHHSSNATEAANARGESGGRESQADAAARMAFQNAVARDNLAIHNTWQDPPPEFSGARIEASGGAGASVPRTNSLLSARPFTPPAGVSSRGTPPGSSALASSRARWTTAPNRSGLTAATVQPRGHLGPRYPYYPYWYSPYYFGGFGFGFFGGFGYGCGSPFWGGFGWGANSCFAGCDPFWGCGYGAFGGYGYFDNYDSSNEVPPGSDYQVFSGGANSPGGDQSAADDSSNGSITNGNSPEDTGLAADESNANEDQPFVLYMKDGSSYAVTRYWVEGGMLHYVTNYGGENSVALDQLNVQETVDQNAALGHVFTLAPAPGTTTEPESSPQAAPPAGSTTPQGSSAPPASPPKPPSN